RQDVHRPRRRAGGDGTGGGSGAADAGAVLTILGCKLDEIGQIGVRARDDVIVRIEECDFDGSRLGLVCDTAKKLTLENVKFQRSSRTCALVHQTPAIIRTCTFRDSASGLELSGTPDVTTETENRPERVKCENSHFDQCEQSVTLREIDAELVKNTISGGNTGITTDGDGTERLFRECRCAGARTAIRCDGIGDVFDQCLLTAGGAGMVGVWIEDEATPLFRNCEIRGFTSDAVRITGNGGGQFDGGILEGPQDSRCVSVEENARPVFRNVKMICEGTEVVRAGAKKGMILEACEISGGGIGIHVTGTGNPRVTGKCQISQNRQVGVQVDANGGGAFEDCVISENGDFALTLGESATATFTRCELRGGASA
ncbi:MAG: right-handed parallel beta-helix repeat-containing protein, partial [Planctomycetia bacterium]|nr:right-handed parallel beta-helix repeat-containing protein [Planctomycetia bacterium]